MSDAEATLWGAVIGGLIGIVGAVTGAYFTVRYQLKKNAEQLFSDCILDLLVGMYPEPINWPRNSHSLLQEKIPSILLAVEKFSFHLTPKEGVALHNAFEKYKKFCTTINDGEIFARPLYQESMPSIDQLAIFKRHVSALLFEYKKA